VLLSIGMMKYVIVISIITAILLLIVYHHLPSQENQPLEEYLPGDCRCKGNQGSANINTQYFHNTTCGMSAFRRGSGQKVIGFAFYEKDNKRREERKINKSWDNPPYFEGVKENLELVSQLYPGWFVRLYHDLHKDDPLMATLCNYVCQYQYFDLCDVRDFPSTFLKAAELMFPMVWRFFPTLDPQVDYFLSRDLDSKVTAREAAAVSEFVESGAAIHALRDHPDHKRPLMGGTWGASLMTKQARVLWHTTWLKMLEDELTFTSQQGHQADQTLLAQYVWPWGANISLQHDSYHCTKFPGSVSFPTQRMDEDFNFVGVQAFTNHPRLVKMWEVCPQECRRYKEWEHC